MQSTNGKTMTSLELVDLINKFRKEETELGDKTYKEVRHDNLMSNIRKEIETMQSLGLKKDALNFKGISYKDKYGRDKPCYELTRDGALQILNKESTYVRVATIKYINSLEEKVKTQVPQLTQEETLALSIMRANDMGEQALAIKEYGSYKHKEGMLHGVIEVSNGRQVTLRQVGGFINEAMGEQFDKIGYIQSDTVVATDFRRFLVKQGHYTMQRFPKKGQEGEYELKRHFQPTELFRTSIVEQGMGYIKNIDDERGKLEGFFYDTITNLINREEFQKAFLKFLKVQYTYISMSEVA